MLHLLRAGIVMEIVECTFGSDIEFFLHNGIEVVSAEGIIPGTKENPEPIPGMPKGFAVQLDNVLAEGNIPPCKGSLEFAFRITKLREYIDQLAGPHGCRTVTLASARIAEKYMTPHAKEYGCSPAKNAWTREEVHLADASESNLRGAGFHVHIGYKDPDPITNEFIVKAMDVFVGLPSVIWDDDQDRRATGYGAPGSYRDKPYGVEYRVLSTACASTQDRLRAVFTNTLHALFAVRREKMDIICNPDVPQAILQGDRYAAQHLLEEACRKSTPI